MVPEQQQRILGYFIEEAKDHLNTIEQGLLNLQATIVNPEMANEVFRAAHSVKGGAAMLGIESMQRTAHRMEDYFKLLKEAPVKVDRSLESMFLQVFDALQELLEQLQGPFGLTEDKEQSIMAGVEPVFQQLQEHLDQLVAAADTNELLEEVAPVAFAKTTSASLQPVEESALKLVFSSDVSAALREMLARFKQADTDDSRAALEACCQMLERFGEQFNLPTWMNLVKHARWAVCDRDNDYRTLAPVLIKEIKKAQDLVLAGQEREIVLSQQLQTLAVQPEPIDKPDSLDDLFADDALFTATEPENTGTSVDIDDLDLDPSLELDGLTPALSSTDDGISIDDLLNDAATSPSGPEVGAAELTSLADLFEAGGDDLDSDWQEEDVPITETTSASESLDIDISPDFEDLLNDDSSNPGNNLSDFESGNELADLFGDTDPPETALAVSDSVLPDDLQLSDATDIGSSALDGLFDIAPAADEAIGGDNGGLFDDEPLSTESDESALEALDSLNELALSAPADASSAPADNDLTDSDLNFDDTGLTLDDASSLELDDNMGLSLDDDMSLELDIETDVASTSEETTASGADSFFDELGGATSGDGPEGSEFDDFFTINESSTEASPEVVTDSLEDDLWTPNSPDGDSTPAAELDSLSDDLWADDNQKQLIDADNLAEDITTNISSPTASVDALTPDANELELDDVWASVEEVDLDLDLDADISKATTSETSASETDLDDLFSDSGLATSESPEEDVAPLENDLDGLFSDVAEAVEAIPETSSQASNLDEDLGDLFGDTSESDGDLGDLLDGAIAGDPVADLDAGDNTFEDLELGTPETNISDVAELDIDVSDLNSADGAIDADILHEPPSSDVDFDLLDLDSEGIVTGFATDDDGLELGTDSNVAENLDIDVLADLTSETASVDNLTPLNVVDDALDELDLETSLDDAEDSSNSNNEASANLETFLDVPSSEQNLEPLGSLLSELPEELQGSTTSEDNDTAPNTDEFGDLEALLDTSSTDVAGEQSAPVPDVEDEFGDLEALLQDADQTLAPTAASSTSYRPTTNRLSSRRMVTDQTMRVSVSHLDNLSNLVGELVVNRNTLEQDQERLRQFLDNLLFQVQQLNDVGQRMRDLYERSLLESSLMSSRQPYQMASAGVPVESDLTDHATGESFDALEMDRFTGFHTLSQEMIELIVRVRESAADIAYTVESSDQVTRQFRQVTNQLQEGLNKARMVPFAQASSRLPRAVRDISVKCGKEARLVVEGRDILIDKMILEQLYDPMTHLVNNAITHGVETPEERRAAGKSPEGVITVRAFYQGNQTVISVGDDGAGIDPHIVKQKALQKGLISQADVQTMTVLDVYDLLFHPGFSTRDQADDFAGRGFGMDVVRTSLADIRGNITIDSELGQGTNFTIRLPLTLSISKALSCISNQARIAFPMDGVEDMFDVSRERIQKNDQGQDCILWRDTLLPFQNLSDLLSFNRTLGRGRVYGGNQDENMVSIVVLRSANSFIALEVDQVMGEQEIVIKQLEGPVPKPTGIAGATVLGDGRVMPIADVLELIDLALGRVRRDPTAAVWSQLDESTPPEEAAKVKSEPTVLIVDDSITVRELLSMSFNKVGYRVEQARDGQEAWEKLRSGLPCDLVFCDIEMPRMDGLELLSRLQKDGGLQQIPIAMLTSRGADRHRQMAVDLGASGYFTKPYLEEALLDAANKMLHGEKLV